MFFFLSFFQNFCTNKKLKQRRFDFSKSNSISRNNSKFGSVFKKNISCSLRRIDSDAVIRDDCARCCLNFEFFSSEFQHGSKRRIFRDAQHFERQFRIRSQSDFKRHFGVTCARRCCSRCVTRCHLKINKTNFYLFSINTFVNF